MAFVYVALGGALGAVGRYTISLIPLKTPFPLATLITNLLGAILIGFVAGLASAGKSPSANAVLFWKTGVCGGFTTFSTFSLEAFSLLENRNVLMGGIYILLSVTLCLCGIACGKRLASMVG